MSFRVKIGDKWFDAREIPICIEMNSDDRIAILQASVTNNKFCQFPREKYNAQTIHSWLNDKGPYQTHEEVRLKMTTMKKRCED